MVPPFSPILNRLLASLAGEDVSFSRMSDLIEKDTVLAGNLLHLVNSALYGRRGTVNSVRHAVSLLGIEKLRNAMLGMSVSRMWNKMRTPPSWSSAEFNLHSAATAVLSDLLAQRLPVLYAEGAFVAGLLHDVGRLIIAISLPAEYDRIRRLRQEGGRSRLECEEAVLGFTHPELSAEVVARWNLPGPIQTAVRYHHRVDLDHSARKPGEIPLSHVLDAADQFVNTIQFAGPADEGTLLDSALAESLELEATGVVLEEFHREFESMKPFFRG